MAFDYKKEYKEFYMPKDKPSIIKVPKMNYIAVRGMGNPNEDNGYELDVNYKRYHHEIYISDPKKCDVSRLKAVMRHPIRKSKEMS